MSIKVLFIFMLLSAAAVIGVSLAVYLRVRRHLKSPPRRPEAAAKGAADQGLDDLKKHQN